MNKEIEIPEGYEARIEGNKVIFERKESEDDRMMKDIVAAVEMHGDLTQGRKSEIYAYLEKQKEQKPRRFKVGDIVTNGDDIYTIDHIGSDCYWLKEHDCATIPFEYEDKWRIVEQKPAEKQDYSGLTDFERAIHRGFLCAGVENVPVTIIKETARDCLAQIKPAEQKLVVEPKWYEG